MLFDLINRLRDDSDPVAPSTAFSLRVIVFSLTRSHGKFCKLLFINVCGISFTKSLISFSIDDVTVASFSILILKSACDIPQNEHFLVSFNIV